MSDPSFLNSEDDTLNLARAHLFAAIDESVHGLSAIQHRISPIKLAKRNPLAAAGIAVAVGVFVMRRQKVSIKAPDTRPWWKKGLGICLSLLLRRFLTHGLKRVSFAQALRVFKNN